METLTIGVDFTSGAAMSAARQLATTVDAAAGSVLTLSKNVDKADDSLKKVAASTEKAAQTVRELSSDWDELSQDVVTVTKDAEEAGRSLAQMAEKVKYEATEAYAEATAKVEQMVEEAKRGTDAVNTSTKNLTNTVGLLGISYAGLRIARDIVQEVRLETQRMIEMQRQFEGNRHNEEESTANLVRNLGLPFSSQGQQRALQIVQSFRARTGTSTDQAVAIIDQAQANGFNVFDQKAQKVNPAGMEVAERMGLFVGMENIDKDTAGKLLNLATMSGVKDEQGLQGFLAQLKVAQQQTRIGDSRQFFGGLLEAATTDIAMGVPVNKAVGRYAAAAAGETEPLRAATNADVYRRVASGELGSDSSKLFLANRAAEQGLISGDARARGYTELFSTDQQAKAKHDQILAERKRLADKADAERIQDLADKNDLEKATYVAEGHLFTGRDGREKQKEAKQNLDLLKKRIAERRSRFTNDMAASQTSLDNQQQELDNSALIYAFKSLSQEKKLDLLDSLSDAEKQTLIKLLPGKETSMLVPQLTGVSAKVARDVAAAAGSPAARKDLNGGLRDYQNTNTLFQSGVSQSAQDRIAQMAAGPAGSYLQDLQGQGETMAKSWVAKGQGAQSFFGNIFSGTSPIFGKPYGPKAEMNAGSPEALNALGMFHVLVDQANAFYQSMTDDDRRKHPEVGEFISKLNTMRPNIMAEAHLPFVSEQVLPEVKKLGEEFYGISNKIKSDDGRAGKPSPSFLRNPSAPGADGAQGGGVSVNIHIGNHFESDGSILDLPGRLEGLG